MNMNAHAFLRMIARRAKVAMACGMTAMLGMGTAAGNAADIGAPFMVTVHLQTGLAPPSNEFCTVIGAFAASVTVSCPADRVRFITRPPLANQPLTGESNVEAGIVTSWRKIRLGDKDYLEMTVRW